MRSDVIDLRDFYATRLGQVARRMIRRRLRHLWPDASGQRLLGLGFATPYLRPFLSEAERVVALMPARQGVLHWPPEGPNCACLAETEGLPFPDRSMDLIVMVHEIEHSERQRAMLRECWRVLTDGGRLMVIAPNRRGLWSMLERTPFGHGTPYSESQLKVVMRDNLFTPLRTDVALLFPPTRWRWVLSWAPAIEQIGSRWFSGAAGVVLMECGKQLYAGTPLTAPEKGQAQSVGARLPNSMGRGMKSGVKRTKPPSSSGL